MLLPNPAGHYHFLKGIDPYSSGVIADPGFEIVHVILRDQPPWRLGFERVDAHLAEQGLDRSALCAVQLRCPRPYSIEGFIQFNDGYRRLLAEWDLLIDGLNPVARTNVAPSHEPPGEPCMFAFSHTAPAADGLAPSLVVAGAGELRGGALEASAIVRRGDTSEDGMRDKAVVRHGRDGAPASGARRRLGPGGPGERLHGPSPGGLPRGGPAPAAWARPAAWASTGITPAPPWRRSSSRWTCAGSIGC